MALTAEKEARLVELLRQEKRIKATRNEIYQIFRSFAGRYAVLIGGSGSGKSYEVADKIIDRIVSEDGHRILCCRAEQKQVANSQFPLIERRIKYRYADSYARGEWRINRSNGNEKITYLPAGNQILFSGLDNVEKLKSIFDITGAWVEEADQVQESDLAEIDRRLRGYEGTNKSGAEKYMQICMSFNPVSVLSWLKKRFFDNPDRGQIMLHGLIPFSDCADYRTYACPDLHHKVKTWDELRGRMIEIYEHNTLVLHSTYLDNKFVGDQYGQVFIKLKETDEDEYDVYALGLWGITGGIFFNAKNVNARILSNTQPIKQGYFDYTYEGEKIPGKFEYEGYEGEPKSTASGSGLEHIRWIGDESGPIKIYEEPVWGHPYVGGGDTAGDGSDFNAGAFTDNFSEIDAATIRTQLDEDEYARQMYCLGLYYNNALLAIETNFSTHPNKELERLGYTNLYVREKTPDTFAGQPTKRYGFLTTKLTRPLALGMLRTVMREHPERVKDLDTLHEMTTFTKNERGKPEAAAGAHDDCIIARAINCYVSDQQRRSIEKKPEKISLIRAHKDKIAKKSIAEARRSVFR